MKKQLLIVDGYNMIGAWPELHKLQKQHHLEEARDKLLHQLSNYSKFQDIEVLVVFDAQFVPGTHKKYNKYRLEVVFTSEKETADSYIERVAIEKNTKLVQVTVATSDLAEQWVVFTKGALRMSAKELYNSIQKTKQIEEKMVMKNYSDIYKRNSPWNDAQMRDLQDFFNKIER